jgi:hypothetical protein
MDTNKHDEGDALAGDILVGATAIAKFLVELGFPEETTDESVVYHLRRTKRAPIGSDGAKLMGSKRRLTRHYQKITT